MPKKSPHENLDLASEAVASFLAALGVPPRAELEKTPARAAKLWREELLAGEGIELESLLTRAIATEARDPVYLLHLGVHLVCPHHLTVAFGEAHVAYLPAGRLASFGAISRLVAAATARLTLQETATTSIARALTCGLGARAAVAVIEAMHPCHNVTHPRAHKARAVTIASAGARKEATGLRRELSLMLASSPKARASKPRSRPRRAGSKR